VACVLAQAADVGAPHKRERLFFLAHRSRERLEELARVGAAGVDGAARCDGADVPDTGGVALRELAERREGAAQPADAGDAEPGHAGQPRLAPFPPRPDDAAGWGRFLARYPDAAPIVEGDTRAAGRRAESALRRGVDGLAAWLGEHPRDAALGLRVDQLRLLGNGVVPAQAAWSLDHCLTALLDHDPNPHGDP
jgi:DNA (cytosine-5)-methyltransferase 1